MFYLKAVLKSTRISPEVECIINELKSGELEVRNVPEEFALDLNVVRAERKLGLRKSGHRGFDVITQKFFVEEQWSHKDLSDNLISRLHQITFDSFAEYYEFLDGDIYKDACYYQYTFEDEFSKALNLDMNRLTVVKNFVTETIDDYSYELSQDEIAEYDQYEKGNKKLLKQWLDKFNACNTYEQFQRVCNNYEKSSMAQYKCIDFLCLQYAIDALQKKNH